jgi:hypothetical protein
VKRRFEHRDGERLFVVRPQDPRLAIEVVRELAAKMRSGEVSQEDGERQFNEILTKQPYTFVGYYASDRKNILDAKGWAIGKMRPGDSFVGSEVVKAVPLKPGDRMQFYAAGEDPTLTDVVIDTSEETASDE